MPFKSEKQRKFLYSQKPEVAKKFAKDSPKKTIKRGSKKIRSPKRDRLRSY